jgi:fructose transport system substrate-binding protein
MSHRTQGRRRRSIRQAVLLALAVTVLVAVAAVAPSASTAKGGGGDDIKIGLITKTETNPFFVKMKEGAQQRAKALGVELMTAAGRFDGDNASQVTAIENMVTAGVKAILITPSDTKAIVPAIKKARARDVLVIALDTPTDPQSATDALFATNNFTAGVLIGRYAKARFGNRTPRIATLDLAPGITVGVLRHNGFLKGFGTRNVSSTAKTYARDPRVVCSADTQGDQAKGQTAMENCLQRRPDINLVYTINEPAAAGAYRALRAAGKAKNVLVVSVDGGCAGVRNVRGGVIAATSQQYPLKMASLGVQAGFNYARSGKKVAGYTDTGVTLITSRPAKGVPSKGVAFGLANCWG